MSTTDMHRSESSSSSVTVHPLSNEERKGAGSSSTSSSPTFQSNSSSAHKTNSTVASSLQTFASQSSFQQRGKEAAGAHATPPTAHEEEDGSTAINGNTDHSTDRGNTVSSPRIDRDDAGSSRRFPERSRWNEQKYREMDDDSYSLHDEEAPIQYPPKLSEEEQEARRVEQKLEQWAAEEKRRRKAKRSSRTASTLVAAPASNRLSKRLSVLGSLASGKGTQPTLPEPVSAAFQDAHGNVVEGALYGKKGAISSDALVDSSRASNTSSRWTREGSMSGLGDVPEHYHDDDRSLHSSGTYNSASSRSKGKGREASNPFSDPVPSSKPTPRHPIVTPGRAPTIKHRALEHGRYSEGRVAGANGSAMPSIVATDADEEIAAQAALDRFKQLEDDPFQSASERDESVAEAGMRPKRPAMKSTNSSYTIGSTIDENTGDPSMPKRKSTNSRFNEIGLDDGQDASGWQADDPDGARGFSSRNTMAHSRSQSYTDQPGGTAKPYPREAAPHRSPWWTEWLCGCAEPTDADLEQSGRTFPE